MLTQCHGYRAPVLLDPSSLHVQSALTPLLQSRVGRGVCSEALNPAGQANLLRQTASVAVRYRPSQALHCARCQRTFSRSDSITDLTLTSGITSGAYRQSFWPGTQIFQWVPLSEQSICPVRCFTCQSQCCLAQYCRTSAVSFAYERGWRQSFASAGFPGRSCSELRGPARQGCDQLHAFAGPDEEFRIAMDYLKPAHDKVKACIPHSHPDIELPGSWGDQT